VIIGRRAAVEPPTDTAAPPVAAPAQPAAAAQAQPVAATQPSTSQAASSPVPGGVVDLEDDAQDEPLDEDELWAELVEHNNSVLQHAKNGVNLPLVIIRSPGGMFARQTRGLGCLLAPTAEVLRARQPLFEGEVRVRREKFQFHQDFIAVPPEYRSACSCSLGYAPSYDMHFVDAAGAPIEATGAFLPYGGQFGGSVAPSKPDPADLEGAAEVNGANLESRDPELQWQLGRYGLLLIGHRMNDEDTRAGHSSQNLIAMAEYLPGSVVGGGRISFREDRWHRVTYVFHSVSAANREAVLREAKRAAPGARFECIETDDVAAAPGKK
jgi:hypothetical protein